MSGHTWRLIDWFRDNRGRSKTRLAINSNLGAEVDVDRLIASTQGLNVEIYTSMESVGAAAEYIRDGLDYSAWQANVRKLLDAGITVHCMCTINSLCLPGLVDHLNYLLELKQLYGRNRVNFTLNILRFPSFQSPLVLSDALRTQYRDQLTAWLHSLEVGALRKYWHLMHEHELNHTQRLVDYLDVVKTPHSDAFEMPKLLNDFQQFFQQYDQRRNKDFELAFPELKEWYNNL
jgi:hypothetical protein